MTVIDKTKASATFGGQRIDTLIALAQIFSDADSVAKADSLKGEAETNDEPDVRRLLSGLSKIDCAACEVRLVWFENLSTLEQARWVRQSLGRVRDKQLQLDSNIDASHVVERLRHEPPRVRAIICSNLAAPLAELVDAELKINQPDSRRRATRESDSAVGRAIRRAFHKHFARLRDINSPSHTDALTRSELARTLRLSGVRETALACRGIEAVESVAAFVRRFEASDARAVLALISTLTDVTPERVAAAGELLERVISDCETERELLDRTGLYLLAAALSTRDAASVRYTVQKLPFEIARELESLIEEARHDLSSAAARARRDEVESIATEVRRVSLSGNSNLNIADKA